MHRTAVAFALPMGLTLGGSNTWSLQMASVLRGTELEPVLLQHPPVGGPGIFELKPPAGVRCVRCRWRYGAPLTKRSVRSLSRSYSEALPALYIPNMTTAAYAACALLSVKRAADLRIAGIAHGQGALHLQWLTYYESVIQEFIAVSDEVAADLRTRIPHRAHNIHVRACAVEVPDSLHRGYSSSGTPLQLVYAGRLTNHEKRVHKLLPLAQELQRRGVDFHLRIIGDGGFRWGLGKAIEALDPDLQKRIALESPRAPQEMPEIWAGADVCVLVSDREGTAVSMLEAMAHGCVPVVTRVSGTAAVIDHGLNGFTVGIDDLASMADCIAALAADRSLLPACGRRGHEKIASRYSLQAYREWFLNLVDKAWSDSPRAWDSTKPLIMPDPPEIHPCAWARLKKMFSKKI